MDCSKFHMTCYVMFHCLQTEVNVSNIAMDKPLLMHGTVHGNSVNILELSYVLCLLDGFLTNWQIQSW